MNYANQKAQAIGQLGQTADHGKKEDLFRSLGVFGLEWTHMQADLPAHMERCNLLARSVGLIYNLWSWYVCLAHPKTHLEAITLRPLLLCGVARLTQHAGQSRLLLTLTHAGGDQIKIMLANIRKGIDSILATAP